MPRESVVTLFKRTYTEPDFRKRLNRANGRAELEAILKEEGLTFTDGEFEDAFNNMHMKCQTEEDAFKLKEFKAWWSMLVNMPAK